MSEPLKVSRIYVPIHLHSDPSLTYKLASELVAAEAQRDPNALFRVERERLESRVRTASDPIEVIRTKTHCIILGDPGAGKTTFLKHLALRSADKQLPGLPDLPIHIELSTFANSGSIDLLDFAANKWEERYRIPKTKAYTYMVEHMDEGKALLLLDALDETVIGETGDTAEALYKRIVEAIQKVARAYPTAPIVVTARKAGYYQRAIRLTAFTELEVLDFRRRDIRRFVDDWFARYTDPQKRIKGKTSRLG
jgi:predicted NACHT family NTPase